MLEHPEDAPTLYCAQCSYVTVWPFQLDWHNQRNHENTAAELFKSTTKPKPYFCICCSSKTYYKLSRYEHCISKHDARTVQEECIGISLQFTESCQRYSCNYCEYKGHSILSAIEHLHLCEMVSKVPSASLPATASVTSNEMDPLEMNSNFQCTQCSYKARTELSFKRHLLLHRIAEETKWFNCTKCSYCTQRKSDLTRHTMTAHVPDNEIKWYNCIKCSYRAKQNPYYLKRHMLSHGAADEVNWFTCTECPYSTKWKATLKSHVLTHADWVNCPKCSYRTKEQKILEFHVLLKHAADAEIDWFSCAECSYRTEQKKNLTRHMVTHARDDDVKWFDCTECPYRSKRKRDWKRHLLTHAADEKHFNWFNCTQCSYRSKTKRDLERHTLKVHVTQLNAYGIESSTKRKVEELGHFEVVEENTMAPEAIFIQDEFAIMQNSLNDINGILEGTSTR